MKFRILTIIIVTLCLPLVLADVSCNPDSLTASYNFGDTKQISTQCTNTGNSTTITLTGETDYISTTETNFNSGTKTIDIDLSSSAPPGLHSGTLSFGTGYSVPIFFLVEGQDQQPTSLISFPTSKRINVQQGNTYDKKLTMIMPSNYPNTINIQSIEFSEENNIISFGDVETGILNPGEVKDIPLKINAKDAQVGEYPTISVQVRFDDNGEIVTLSSALHIIVSANLNPSTNITFSRPPSCSLSASIMNLNQSYSFTCSNVQKNLEVSPVFNEYFEGQNVILSGDIYTYELKPIKYGNTDFISTFTYLGAPLFAPFRQEVKISSSTSTIPGTELKFKFTPELDNIYNGDEVIIQLIDNKSGNLVENPSLYINAIPISPLNNSDKSFPYKLDVTKIYELRGEAEGYDNIVNTINISKKEIEIAIEPEQNEYQVGDILNITTIPNASIMINEIIITSPYIITTSGNKTIKAVKEGHLTTNRTIIVLQKISYKAMTPPKNEWVKGKKVLIELTENSTWTVYNDDELMASGEGNMVDFEITDYGVWTVRTDDQIVTSLSKNIEKKSWFGFLSWTSIKNNWLIWIIVIIVIGVIIWLLFRDSGYKEPMDRGGDFEQ